MLKLEIFLPDQKALLFVECSGSCENDLKLQEGPAVTTLPLHIACNL